MNNKLSRKINNQKGSAMFIALVFFLFISLAIISGLVSPTVQAMQDSGTNLKSKKSYYLAESGNEDAFYRILKNKPITGNETLTIDSDSVETIINSGSNTKEIVSTGDVSNYQRKLNLSLTAGDGAAFNYGVQVGQGGLKMEGSAGINGNVYANGPIQGDSATFISGTAISANSSVLVADQSNGSGTPDYDVIFANDSTSKQDFAQSFQLSTSAPLNKVQIYMKKVSTPSSVIAVKIVNDASGSPGTTVYVSKTIPSNLITTSYGWVEVSFDTNPLLNKSTTYWLVVDSVSNSTSKYYVVGASNGGYDGGLGKIGQLTGTWNNTNPSGLDYFFKIYLGGVNGIIFGTSGSQYNRLKVGTGGSGIAQAHTVNYTSAPDGIYCQSGTGNNKSCNSSNPDPAYIPYPISDGNIAKWKSDAELGGSLSTFQTPTYGVSYLGPKVIQGNLNVLGSNTLYLTGTVWVKGYVRVTGTAKIVLDPSYGNSSGILVADGRLELGGSGQLNGTGQPGSYILFTTTSNCDATVTCSLNAIDISGAAGSVILNAPNGTISFSGSASAKEAIGNKLYLGGTTTVSYESGLANVSFTSGPTGGWNVSSWKETD